MKTLKYILSFALVLFMACADDNGDLSFLDTAEAPSEVSVLFNPTQDNSGLVTMTPNANGAVKFIIDLGDGITEPVTINQGEEIEHVYPEGTYTVTTTAIGITGLETGISENLVISFKAPENLDITIENDAALSKQVNVTVNADFAISYDVFFGEDGIDDAVTGNVGDTVSYTYNEAGTYTIRIVVMGSAIATTEYVEEFEVTAILQPLASAPSPPFRQAGDVIGIFSDKENYDYNLDNDFFPYWNQGDNWNVGEFLIDTDKILRYTGLTYQGIQLGAEVDASSMEFLHLDVWTADDNDAKLSPISSSTGEQAYNLDLVANQWTSFDIPLSYFTDLGLSMSDIAQFKFDGNPAGGTIFVDNIYFWKEASTAQPLLFDDFEGNGNVTTWAADALTLDTSVPNPYVNADNFSDTVLKYNDEGGQYANLQLTADSKFDLSGPNTVFKIKIYVPSSSITGNQPNQVSLKLQNSELGGNGWQTQTEIIKEILLDQWQELSFDFSSDPFINLSGDSPDPVDRTDLDKVVIQLNSENNNDLVVAYLDDFYYGPTTSPEAEPIIKDGFEGFGTISTWTGDALTLNTSVANPYIDSNNGSPTVLEYIDDGGQYANAQFTVTPKFNLVDKNKFTLMIYVPSSSITGTQVNQVSLKLQNSELGGNAWQTQTEIIKPIVLDQWQELTFDFVNDNWINLNNNGVDPDPIDRTDLDKVVIQLNSENNNDQVTAYIDNLNYHN